MLKILLELTKARITLAVTLSVATGHVLFVGTFSPDVLLPATAVFLLACGSAALNQVQEARLDARMDRTRTRPIPSGRIQREWALFIAMVFMGAGFYLLSSIRTHTFTLLGLAAFAVVWYNVVYVLLKRITAFAVVPGALVGAVPPMIGWASGGGMITDPAILRVAFFFFLWQIPHFWLLLLLFGREYEKAGLPTLTRLFSHEQIARITCVWMLAVAATGLFLGMTEKMHLPWNIGMVLASLWLGVSAFGFIKKGRKQMYLPGFIQINVYALLVMIFLMGQAVA